MAKLTKATAMRLLRIGSPRQLDKLLETELLLSLDSRHVEALADWPDLQLDEGEYGIAVHVGPYREQNQDYSNSRKWCGWTARNPKKLNSFDHDRAWVGDWPVSENRAAGLRGGLLVGDIAGFIPSELVRQINDYSVAQNTENDKRVVFEVEAVSPDSLRRLGNKRIVAKPGNMWQTL